MPGLPGISLGPCSGFLIAPVPVLAGACGGAWCSGRPVPVPAAHGAPFPPALLRLEPCLELNRAPTLSFLGHVPISYPRGNRVMEGTF